MITRITRLSCGLCGETRRVKVRIVGDTEVMSPCPECGPTTWLAVPTLHLGEAKFTSEMLDWSQRPQRTPMIPLSMWRAQLSSHQGCGDCDEDPALVTMGRCGCECHRRMVK
jgi:hypothetical protein